MYNLGMNSIPQRGEVWQHYRTKGKYEILGIGKLQVKQEELDMKECVLYKSLADDELWVRPLEDFLEQVEDERGQASARFTKLKIVEKSIEM
jgi:hypothetical protein